jgi:DNA-binding NarL/FixJ family response regulator
MTIEPPDKIRVLLVSPAPLIRSGLRVLLDAEAALTIVGEANSPACGERLAPLTRPHVIVLDLLLERAESIDAIPYLLVAMEHCRVVVISWHKDPRGDARAMSLGASGLVLQQECSEVLVKAIQKVHTGELWLNRSATTAVIKHLVRQRRDVDDEQAKIDLLTKREREVVGQLGEGLNNKRIGERLFISEATVRNHVTSVLGKLELSNRFELAVYAFRNGLVEAPILARRFAKPELQRPHS